VPVIASGGAGKQADFAAVLTQAGADAALAASVFHDGDLTVQELKQYLDQCGIPIRKVKTSEA
jgi:cyclase